VEFSYAGNILVSHHTYRQTAKQDLRGGMMSVCNVGSWVLLFFHNLSIGRTGTGYTCELVMHTTCLFVSLILCLAAMFSS
jgi:hypothetical protein